MNVHGGMSELQRNGFLKKAGSLILDVFSVTSFHALYDAVLDDVKDIPTAVAWLQDLDHNKEKVCAAYTANVFTAGH
ncbi:hypothetical protein SPRG_17423, partial [Saprolegnia parasitica CBS 223.65]